MIKGNGFQRYIALSLRQTQQLESEIAFIDEQIRSLTQRRKMLVARKHAEEKERSELRDSEVFTNLEKLRRGKG